MYIDWYWYFIAERFTITKADVHIKVYEDAIEEFCCNVTTHLSLQESLVVFNNSPLKCETTKFVEQISKGMKASNAQPEFKLLDLLSLH